MSSPINFRSRRSLGKLIVYAIVGIVVSFVILLAGARWHLRQKVHSEIERIRAAGQPATLEELAKRYADLGNRRNASPDLTAAVADLRAIWDGMATNGLPGSNLRIEQLPFMNEGPKLAATDSVPDAAVNALNIAMTNTSAAFDRLSQLLSDSTVEFRQPIVITNGFNMLLPHLSQYRQVAKWYTARIAWQLERGETEAAVESTARILNLSRAMSAEPTIISQLVRLAIIRTALESVQRLVTQRELSKEQLKLLRRKIARARPTHAMHTAMIGERCFGLNFLYFQPGNLDEIGSLNPQPTRISPGSVLMMLYRMSGLADRDTLYYLSTMKACVAAATNAVPARLQLASSNAFKPQSQHKFAILSAMLLPALGKCFDKEAECLTSVAAADSMLTVEEYRIDHQGKIPASLAEMVPDYFNAAPIDPTTESPLTITPTAKGYTIDGRGPLFHVGR